MKKIPAYIQVYEHIQKKIIHGSYTFGMRIPSKREMAEEEKVSVITIEHAYALLEEEGYIEAKQRSGYYVCYQVGDVFNANQVENTMALPMQEAETFPTTVFAKACRKVLSLMHEQLPSKSEGQGNMQLREAIRAYLMRSRDIQVSAQQIIIGAGSEYLYALLVDLLGRDKIYGIEAQGYEKIEAIYQSSGAVIEKLKLGKHGIVTSALQHTNATVLHVTPYHSYPTGNSTDASKRREYIQWAIEKNAYIIEDDYASEFAPSIKNAETLYTLQPECVIYMNTFTKTISSSIRIGYMILPEALIQKYQKTQSFRSCTVSEYMQLVVTELLNNGAFERNLNRMRRKRKKI